MTSMEHQKKIISDMKKIGTYKPQFRIAVQALAQIMEDYDRTLEEFLEGGEKIIVEYTNKAGATNEAKNPLYLALETLRKQILDYLRELGLTPAGLKKINEDQLKGKKASGKLASALENLDAL